MKKLLIVLFMGALFNSLEAQIIVGKRIVLGAKKFEKGEIERIKNKTTVFKAIDVDKFKLDSMLRSVWTFNKYIVIDDSDFSKEKYYNNDYAIFDVDGIARSYFKTSGRRTSNNLNTFKVKRHFYHFDVEEGEITEENKSTIAAVFLSPDGVTANDLMKTREIKNLDSGYFNFSLGYFKNQLQLINERLNKKETHWAYNFSMNEDELNKLKSTILYVPDYMKTETNAFNGVVSDSDDADKLFKKYKGKYEWISDEEINLKILKATSTFYYLSWCRINAEKFIAITNGFTGEIIYKKASALSYNINRKDIDRIAKEMK